MFPAERRPVLAGIVLLALVLGACNEIDKLLEAEPVIETSLSVATDSAQLTIPRGSERTITVRVTRPEGNTHQVQVSLSAPTGVTASFANFATSGLVTSVLMTLQVAESTPKGTYFIGVRGKGTRVNDGLASIILHVIDPPSYTLTLSTSSITITRGGQGPSVARIARTSFTAGVALSLEAPAGITAAFNANPVTGDSSRFMIAVESGVAAGTHTVTVHAAADGLPPRTATLSVTVTTDPVQLIVMSDVSGPQGATTETDVLVNRSSFDGSVALIAEDAPAGVSVAFAPSQTTTTSSAMTVSIGPLTPPGDHIITVRGQGSGVPDAVTTFKLTVAPTTLSLSLSPASLAQFVGTSVTSVLSITRSGHDTAVSIAVENLSPGLSVVPQTSNTEASAVGLTIAATAATTPGDYAVVIRGTLDGFPASTSQTATLNVTVRAAPAAGNVILDWGRCAVPTWVAYQDEFSPWVPVTPTAGVFRFSVSGTRGGYAYADENTVNVRFMSQAELTAKTFDMCAAVPGTKTIDGIGVHSATTNELFNYRLGGASASSFPAQPQFALSGVAEGVQDLFAFGTTPGVGSRVLLIRDVNLADGESLGQVDVMGAASFPLLSSPFTATFGLLTGETIQTSMSYLTTSACVVNTFSTNAVGFGTNTMSGVPAVAQRATDYHMLTLFTSAATWSRSISHVFHALGQRAIALPLMPGTPFVGAIGGSSYKRLNTFLNVVPGAYNRMATLQYQTTSKSMSVGVSLAYNNFTTSFSVTMPDLSVVSGFPMSATIPADGTGSWSVTYEGSNTTEPPCSEGRQTMVARRIGSFF